MLTLTLHTHLNTFVSCTIIFTMFILKLTNCDDKMHMTYFSKIIKVDNFFSMML